MKYISKGEWFDKGTEAKPLGTLDKGLGMFLGMRNGKLDEEWCKLDEFEIEEENEDRPGEAGKRSCGQDEDCGRTGS